MKDQAENLRLRLNKIKSKKEAKTISVISGKGGVGKSNFSLNFSISLSQKGKNVLLFDMDIGMGNIDILMGNTSSKNIVHFFEEELSFKDVITKGPADISYIAGGTGLSKIFRPDSDMVDHFFSKFEQLLEEYDYIIFDMGAGIAEDTVPFLLSSDEIFVITTPEPTAITDAYAAMKYITLLKHPIPFYLICNKVYDEKEGMNTLNRLQNAVGQFLNKEITILGILPEDKIVSKAVRSQTPFLIYSPHAKISNALNSIINKYETKLINEKPSIQTTSFIGRLRNYVFGR